MSEPPPKQIEITQYEDGTLSFSWYTGPERPGDPHARTDIAYVRKDIYDEAMAALRGAVEAMERCNVGDTVPGMNRLIAARQAIAKAEGSDG